MTSNIKCGNSLIGTDIYDQEDMQDLSRAEKRKINAFDWEDEFPDIMKNGGFDCVVGNPPYLRIQGLQEHYNLQVEFYTKRYKSAVKRFDFYLLFMERGFGLVRENGLLGYICPHKFINSDFGSGLRKFLIEKTALKRIISFGNNQIFDKASTYTGIFLLENKSHNKFDYYEFQDSKIEEIQKYLSSDKIDYSKYSFKDLTEKPWVFTDVYTGKILRRLNSLSKTTNDIFEYIVRGVQSTADDIFCLKGKITGDYFTGYSDRLNQNIKLESAIMKPILKGEDVKKYTNPRADYYTIYPHYLKGNKTLPIEESELKKMYPLIYEYLNNFKKELIEKKVKYKTNSKYWYSMHRAREIQFFKSLKIITPVISLGCNMTLCDAGIYHNVSVCSLIPKYHQKENLLYWLGILNSKVLWKFISNTSSVLRGGYYTFSTNYLAPFPIPTINFNNPDEVKLHDKVVKLVSEVLTMYEEKQTTRNPSDLKEIEREIKTTDKKIDNLVYELYGLTDEEIAIVEKTFSNA